MENKNLKELMKEDVVEYLVIKFCEKKAKFKELWQQSKLVKRKKMKRE